MSLYFIRQAKEPVCQVRILHRIILTGGIPLSFSLYNSWKHNKMDVFRGRRQHNRKRLKGMVYLPVFCKYGNFLFLHAATSQIKSSYLICHFFRKTADFYKKTFSQTLSSRLFNSREFPLGILTLSYYKRPKIPASCCSLFLIFEKILFFGNNITLPQYRTIL